MKLTIERNTLHAALGRVSKCVESRNTIPILSNVLLVAKDGTLAISATDLDVSATATVNAEVATPGAFTVPAHLLASMVAKLPASANVMLEFDGSKLLVRSGRTKATLFTLPASDFPEAGSPKDGRSFKIAPKDLVALIANVDASISTEETRYYLNGIYLHTLIVDGKMMLRTVATDGHKLSLFDMPIPAGYEQHIPGVIIPRKAVGLIKALAEKSAGDVDVNVAANRVEFTFADGVTFSTKVIDATFPDYPRVIPQANEIVVRVDRAALSQAVNRVATIGGKAVKLAVSSGVIELSVRSPDNGDASEEIEADYDGEPIVIGFNATYLNTLLAVLTEDTLILKLRDSGSPAVLLDHDGGAQLLILMPLNV